MEIPATINTLLELARNASIGKHANYNAAERSKKYKTLFGVPVVVINVALGSVFFFSINQELPDIAKWIGALLALLAASLAALQTYFNFNRTFEAHRSIANRYNELCRECERLYSLHADELIETSTVADELKSLLREYADINKNAEPFPTDDKDFQAALTSEDLRQRGLFDRKTGTIARTNIENA